MFNDVTKLWECWRKWWLLLIERWKHATERKGQFEYNTQFEISSGIYTMKLGKSITKDKYVGQSKCGLKIWLLRCEEV